ncbi:hypothetical protein [Photorhabdus sp. SF281]|uniref:hypothetical protein n=1 Tax=Photorhabdus sp. SF281 TaxID=3459527 RepID=UPI0040446487
MTDSVFKKALAALEGRGLTLAESVNRIFLILPEYGRLNVAVINQAGEPDTATLTVQPDGQVSCRLSGEPRDNSPVRKEW